MEFSLLGLSGRGGAEEEEVDGAVVVVLVALAPARSQGLGGDGEDMAGLLRGVVPISHRLRLYSSF